MYEFLLVTKAKHIATVSLNRPEKRNALHGPLAAELIAALKEIALDDTRVLLLTGQGDHFCAGGDLAWMQKIATESAENNLQDAQLLADALYQLYSFPKPTIVLAQGAVIGGGVGLLAAADIAIVERQAEFSLPEVKFGMTPSMISPYVLAAIGERAAHRYFLTGERFNAETAYRIGLVHQVVEASALLSTGEQIAQQLLQNSPNGMRAAKELIRSVAKTKISPELSVQTAKHLASLRTTPEAQEGLRSFVEKRKPNWRESD